MYVEVQVSYMYNMFLPAIVLHCNFRKNKNLNVEFFSTGRKDAMQEYRKCFYSSMIHIALCRHGIVFLRQCNTLPSIILLTEYMYIVQ